MTSPVHPQQPDRAARQARSRRLAAWLGAIAVAVFVGFISMMAAGR